MASGGAVALSARRKLFDIAQLPGRPANTISGSQDRDFSNVLVIAAHPGDAFFAMGAPVAVASHVKGEGYFLSLSMGERGSPTVPAQQYGYSQQQAAQKAATALGAKALFLHYPDGEIPVNDEAKFAVCDMIRQCRPSTIVTHWKGSWHKDHRACYEIVQDAIFYAGLPAIVRKETAHTVRKLYFASNWEDSVGFAADTYLDITSVCDDWLNACSVFPMWLGENGFRYKDYYSSMAVADGCISDFKRAVALMSSEDQRIRNIPTPTNLENAPKVGQPAMPSARPSRSA
jgi:LmbE family N-acetylglucosaminyl deacetylase